MEEIEKPRYPKHLDVGRIVIEEIPEEKKEVTKRDDFKRDEVKPRDDKDTTTLYRVGKDTKQQVKEDVIEVGRMDVTDYEKTEKEPGRFGKGTSIFEKDRKVTKINLQTAKEFFSHIVM